MTTASVRHCRILFFASALAAFSFSGCSEADSAASSAPAKSYDLLVGSYTEGRASSGKSKGVAVFRFDAETGEARPLAVAEGVRNPSWLAVSKDAKFVYAVNELNGDGRAGEVSAFAFDAASGALKFINKVSAEGDDPCHLWLDETGRRLFVSNYTSGNFTVLPLKKDGSLLPREQTVSDVSVRRRGRLVATIAKEDGGTVDEVRDLGPGFAGKKSHVHSVTPLPDGTGVVVADLGWDRVIRHVYSPDVSGAKSLTLAATEPTGRRNLKGFPAANLTVLPDKTGPRHLVFDPSGKHAFLIGETADSVTTLDYAAGALAVSSRVTLGAEPDAGAGTAGAIHLSEDGRFLYASVRDPKNEIHAFAVNPETGELKAIQHLPSGGKAPREFALSPDGRFLLVANQGTDNIAVFTRDPATGLLTATGRNIATGSPSDLKWVPAH